MKFSLSSSGNSDSSTVSRRARTSIRKRLAVIFWITPIIVFSPTLAVWRASADMPRWLQDVVGESAIEAALYRVMELPAARILYPRPPKEAQHELTILIEESSAQAELYSLRANEEEQALDFNAAEADWKAFVSKSSDPTTAKLELANYYHRRLDAFKEATILFEMGSEPATPASREQDLFHRPTAQRSWLAFERLLQLIHDQALGPSLTLKAYDAWIARYPEQPSLYSRELNWFLEEKNFEAGESLIKRYQSAFPHDSIFPIKAAALIEYRRGTASSSQKAVAIYDSGFDPLWSAELIQSYYDVLKETHELRGMVARARAQLASHPDDLKATARLFYYGQQEGNLASAQQVVDAYRYSKEERNAPWSAQELFTLATLMESTHSYAEAARYNYALYHTSGQLSNGVSPQAEGLSGVIRILLNVPDQPLQLGANNLTMYRDIATLDQGPGYWNGILSLWFNSTSPQEEFQKEESEAQPYFYRAKASQLLAMLDRTQPAAKQRATLHLELIRATAGYGESEAVVSDSIQFLRVFNDPTDEANRVQVASLMADAYAQQQNTSAEFALYDRMLVELGTATHGMPLTSADTGSPRTSADETSTKSEDESVDSSTPSGSPTAHSADKPAARRAFEISPEQATASSVSDTQQYAQRYRQILDRYLGRLTATGHLPQALEVLRKELDRNPNDPLLYERLATFLAQNNLSAQQEEVFEEATRKFQDPTWYNKLARLYLHEKKREAFAELTRKVTGIFHGTELEQYFSITTQGGPQLFLELNLYAHRRFPHDQVFVQNLLGAYTSRVTKDPVGWEALLREHWSDSEQLRGEFFSFLSRTGKLDIELKSLQQLVRQQPVPQQQNQSSNPAATRELANALLWQSHYEESAPLLASLAFSYPADEPIGNQAASVFRSLAYFDPNARDRAIQVEKQLLSADPSNTERLATVGDVYSDAAADGSAGKSSGASPGKEQIAFASESWRRIPQVHPGSPEGYLQAATIFWDYFRFDEALAEINQARGVFHQPALYGYEAGAIEESKRNFAAAIHEYTAAAITQGNDQPDNPAIMRLLKLARRSATAKLVDDESAHALETHPGVAALDLRSRVLEVEKRGAEIRPLLERALSKTTSFEEVQIIASQAQTRNLDSVYESALRREITLVSDPVQKIELTFQLVSSYESHKDLVSAARLIQAEYHDNPRLLGVVRATTDFYWNNDQRPKAIDTLIDASKSASAPLKKKLLVEAASKANESGNYAQARDLIGPLISPASAEQASDNDAFNPTYLAVMADSYAQAGDNAGLEKFYLAELTAIRNIGVSKSPEERKQKIILLRRGLIPALTRLNHYSGAMDQYVAILDAYPEDSSTTQEAALYALRYGQQQPLLNATTKAVQDSPRDSRFAVMLAEIQTTFGNDAAALDAYSKAVAIRSDRSDLYIAKADLEEHLQRLDDACQDYQRLYKLSYQNPDWMVKIATARARQGRADEAVSALEEAWITGRPKSASNYFQVATQLENWAMLNQALHFAELGVKAEGDDLLAGSAPGNQNGDDASGAATYLRISTRVRLQVKSLSVLDEARNAANISPDSPTLVAQQVEKRGLASVTDDQWRTQRAAQRKSTAQQRYHAAILQMATAVNSYFTPEERQQFAQLIDQRWKLARSMAASPQQAEDWIDVAENAGLAQQEASMRQQVLLERASPKSAAQYQPFVALERARMQYSDLATALASYAKIARPTERRATLADEAETYRNAGNEASELHTLNNINFENDENLRGRYLEMLLKHDPVAFQSYSANSKVGGDAFAAPNYATAHGNWKIAEATLASHGTTFGKLWEDAYTALVGLYFNDKSQDASTQTEAAFHSLLGDATTIGERLQEASLLRSSHDAASAQITGSTWFYYGMRFGVYQGIAPASAQNSRAHDPEQLIAAGLESNPQSASEYVSLAKAYDDENNSSAALDEYRHALEPITDAPSVHDQMALLLWKQGKHEDAIAHWRSALVALNHIQDKGPAPETFWTTFAAITQHLESHQVTASLYPEFDALLRNYIARNGNYRSDELLESLYLASEPDAGVKWLLSLSAATNEPVDLLASIDNALWLPTKAREPILLREYELANAAAQQVKPGDGLPAERLLRIRKRLILYYVALLQDDKAQSLLNRLDQRQREDDAMTMAEIELAIRAKKLETFLTGLRSSYTSGPSPTQPDATASKPSLSVIRSAATKFGKQGDTADAVALWHFVFNIGQSNHDLLASDYLGLAEADLQSNDTKNLSNAIDLLRRMTLLPGDPYSNYDLAASLLEKHKRPEWAMDFLTTLAKEVPWNSAYAIRLAQAQINSGHHASDEATSALAALRSVAADNNSSYELRIRASETLSHLAGANKNSAVSFGSHELDLLAQSGITPVQSRQPYFIASRLAAATNLPIGPQKETLLRESLAIDPKSPLNNQTRLKIFSVEAALQHSATALAAIQPLVDPSSRYQAGNDEIPSSAETQDNTADQDIQAAFTFGSGVAADSTIPIFETANDLESQAPLPPGPDETSEEKLALALQLAKAYEAHHQIQQSLAYFKLAWYLDPDSTSRSLTFDRIVQINRSITLEARNSLRRPLIQPGLEQKILVQPMLSALDHRLEVAQ